MITRKKAVPGHAVNLSRHALSLSLIALFGAGTLGTGPAFAADGVHCIHTIDYNKLSANELEMLSRDIDVTQFASTGATGGKCIATVDYNKLSSEELEMQYRDVNVHHYARENTTGGKNVATIDYDKLSAEDLDRINKGIDVVIVDDGADKDQGMSALAGR